MTPRQLQAFIAVAQTLSFVRASERLHMSQAALSLAVRKLEQELGGPLLSRTTRQVRLTQEGGALLPLAMQLIADWENVRERLKMRFTLQHGHVTIAAMPSFAGSVLPRLLQKFRHRFPGIELAVEDVINEQVVELVGNGRVEVGFGFEPALDAGIEFTPMFTDRFVAIVPADSPLARRKSVTWAQLLTQRFIALQRPSSTRRLLEESLAEWGIALRVVLESHQLATIIRFVAAGLGVSAIPAMLRQQARAEGAQVLELLDPSIEKAVGIISRSDQDLSVAAAAIVRIAQSLQAADAQGNGRSPRAASPRRPAH